MSIKVLYTGVYKDPTGWGRFAQNQILALDAAGVQVVPRSIKLDDRKAEVHPRILELEENSAIGCDAVIQNVLPHMMTYNKKAGLNIAYYMHEASNFNSSTWSDYLNMMDLILVPDIWSRDSASNSHVKKPIEILKYAVDLNKAAGAKPLAFREQLKDSFIFYYIGEVNQRKNLPALLRAYLTEFTEDDPVELVIKTTPNSISTEQLQNMVNDVKKGLKLYPNNDFYKKITIFNDFWSEEHMRDLHFSCDAFVSATSAESICIPAVDAGLFENPVIIPLHTGLQSYFDYSDCYSVYWQDDDCFGFNESFNELYTANSEVGYVNVSSLRKQMRLCFDDSKSPDQLWKVGTRLEEIQSKQSFEYIGSLGRKILERYLYVSNQV